MVRKQIKTLRERARMHCFEYDVCTLRVRQGNLVEILCTVESELLHEMALKVNFGNLAMWGEVINDLIIARVISIESLINS